MTVTFKSCKWSMHLNCKQCGQIVSVAGDTLESFTAFVRELPHFLCEHCQRKPKTIEGKKWKK